MRLTRGIRVCRTREAVRSLPSGVWGVTAGQADFLRSGHQFRALMGGVGSGKTYVGIFAVLQAVGERRCTGMIVAPTYKMLKTPILRTFKELVPKELYKHRKVDSEIEFKNGSMLYLRSADNPDSLRGPTLSFFWGDEAALWDSDYTWNMLIARLREHGRAGRGFITTTPRGKNWIYDKFVGPDNETDAERRLRESKFHYVNLSTRDNLFASEGYYEDLKAQFGDGWFAGQELEGRFCEPDGTVFKRNWFKVLESVPDDYVSVIRAWDLAVSVKSSADFTVGVKVGVTAGGDLVVLDVIRRKLEWPFVKELIAQTALNDGERVQVAIEVSAFQLSAFQEIMSDLRLVNHEIKKYRPEKDKLSRALPVAARAEAGKLYVQRASWTGGFIDECCSFDGTGKYHDDQVDALTSAVGLVSRPRPRITLLRPDGQLVAV